MEKRALQRTIIAGFLLFLLPLAGCGSEPDTECDRPMFQEVALGDTPVELQEAPEQPDTEAVTVVGISLGDRLVATPGHYLVRGRITAVFDVNGTGQIEPNELPLSPDAKTGDIDPYLFFTGKTGRLRATLRFEQNEEETIDYDFFAFSLQDDRSCGFFVDFDDEVTQGEGATANVPESVERTLSPYTPYMLMVEGFAGGAGDYELELEIE